MQIDFYAQWLAVLVPLVCSPGPGNILCAVSGAAKGFRGSAPFILGLNFSYAAYSLLAGLGMGAVVGEYPGVFYYIQLLGCAYIFFLGASFFSRRAQSPGGAPKLSFRSGVVSQALNVKGFSIVVLMHSQFLIPGEDIFFRVMQLTAMLTALNLFTHFGWAYGGSWMAQTFAAGKSAKIQNALYGTMLLIVALWLLPF